MIKCLCSHKQHLEIFAKEWHFQRKLFVSSCTLYKQLFMSSIFCSNLKPGSSHAMCEKHCIFNNITQILKSNTVYFLFSWFSILLPSKLSLSFLNRYKCRTTLLVSIPAQASSTVCPSLCPTRCLILPSAHNPCLSPHSSQVSLFWSQHILLKKKISLS